LHGVEYIFSIKLRRAQAPLPATPDCLQRGVRRGARIRARAIQTGICYHTGETRLTMNLREVVEKYLAAAGSYGNSAALASLGLSREEIERAFSAFDEDYHISRFFHFRNDSGVSFAINGFPQTHVSIDAEIQTIL
jgi:hypothetical protein